jgi:hypothetical protein
MLILLLLFGFTASIPRTIGIVIHDQGNSVYFRTPPFVWYNDSFSVRSQLARIQTVDECHDPNLLEKKIVVTSMLIIERICGFGVSIDPHEFARSRHAAGLIRVSTLNSHLDDFTAWKLSPNPFRLKSDVQVPAVIASSAAADYIFSRMDELGETAALNVSMDSSDPNLAVGFFKAPGTVTFFSLAAVHSTINLLYCLKKILEFLSQPEEKMSPTSRLIVCWEVLGNSARLILSVNSAIFTEHFLYWFVSRALFTISVPFCFASTVTISYGRKCFSTKTVSMNSFTRSIGHTSCQVFSKLIRSALGSVSNRVEKRS